MYRYCCRPDSNDAELGTIAPFIIKIDQRFIEHRPDRLAVIEEATSRLIVLPSPGKLKTVQVKMSRATTLTRLLRSAASPHCIDTPLIFRRLELPLGTSSVVRRTYATSQSRNPKATPKATTATNSATNSGAKIPLAPTVGPAPGEPMPRSARYLGLAGTIPFFSCAGAALFAPEVADVAVMTAQMYGVSILSFLGAVHWGVALRTARGPARDWDFVYSVCPSLAAAAAAVLPPQQGLSVLLPSFGAALIYDSVRFAGDPGVPEWYPKLRKPLSIAAMASTGICLGVVWGSGKSQGSVETAPPRSIVERA